MILNMITHEYGSLNLTESSKVKSLIHALKYNIYYKYTTLADSTSVAAGKGDKSDKKPDVFAMGGTPQPHLEL